MDQSAIRRRANRFKCSGGPVFLDFALFRSQGLYKVAMSNVAGLFAGLALRIASYNDLKTTFFKC